MAERQARDALSKTDAELALSFALKSEWDVYEGVVTRSSLLKVIEDKLSLNLLSAIYITYDGVNKKFMGLVLE